MSYHAINADHVIATIERLERRICERFPGRGLAKVCADFAAVARRDRDKVRELRKPYIWVRASVGGILVFGALAIAFLAKEVKIPSFVRLIQPGDEEGAIFDLFQGIDSAVNVVLLLGVGLFFLLRHEERDKQRRALEDLYELRSLAHVIDMHQLTKDPTTLLGDGPRTPSSPERRMSRFELTRYLEYCAEMLALTGKLSAVYAGESNDHVVVAAASDVENLCTDLGRKIWQKITIVEQMVVRTGA